MIHATERRTGYRRLRALSGPIAAAVICAWLTAPGVLRAEEESLPKGDDVLAGYVEAIGGEVEFAGDRVGVRNSPGADSG